jgi:ABC-type lipopolysaccharide export system ATPase subunit
MSDQWSRLDELSYGFRRLFIILVAIEADVRYTILDEPFSSIMPVHNELIISAIRSASDRKGLLISDHQFRTLLSVTDKLYLIFDQHVKLLNSHSELIDYGYLSKGTSL